MKATERILERLVKDRFLLNNALAVLAGEKPKWALHYDDVVDAIASVIGKEGPKIDKDTLRMAIDFGADLEAGVIQMDWKKYETYVDMFLDIPKDLTPKTKEDGNTL